ncbi:hypothetical protein [Streptomyces sp. cmx-4-7]|uniref:hypothetical protein n=1 Tax=Streptomyces sp. cmx-4-7 TaxID=2790939 RepID=UPI0039805AC9
MSELATDTVLWTDDVWAADSTPVGCGRSLETVKRSDLAGWVRYGNRDSHTRHFWGLRLHLLCTLGGLPIAFVPTGAKADERATPLGIFATEPTPVTDRPPGRITGVQAVRQVIESIDETGEPAPGQAPTTGAPLTSGMGISRGGRARPARSAPRW